MRDWYLRQTPRDRLIVLVVGALSVLVLLYALVWYPVESRIATRERALEAKSETLDYLREGAARLRASRGAASPVRQSDKAPYLLIDEVVRRAGIETPERLEPSGATGARVQFSEVPFDQLVRVLAELESYGLSVSTLSVTRKNTGTVSARFDMEKS